MAGRRATYLLVLAAAVLFYIAYPRWLAWYTLIAVLLTAPFDLLISLPGAFTCKTEPSAPHCLEQFSESRFVISAACRFPSGVIKIRLRETTESGSVIHRLRFYPVGEDHNADIDTSHSGVVFYEVSRVRVTSLLGIWSFPKRSGQRLSVLILPKAVKPPLPVLPPQSSILIPKPGGGYSEDHDIRAYRQGDPKNSVHWKLSAKHDTLIVREALTSPSLDRLIYCTAWSSPRERDLILGRLRWMTGNLLNRGFVHYVRIDGYSLFAKISHNEDELTDYLRCILGGEPVNGEKTVRLPTRFSWVFRIDAKEGGV